MIIPSYPEKVLVQKMSNQVYKANIRNQNKAVNLVFFFLEPEHSKDPTSTTDKMATKAM